jgi:hypothetical protein
MNTKISYTYTNAANYKDQMDVVVSGKFSDSEKAFMIWNMGESSENGFIPHKMGLPHLSVVLGDTDGDMQEAIDLAEDEQSKDSIKRYEHPFRLITKIELTNEEPNTPYLAQAFYTKLRELCVKK